MKNKKLVIIVTSILIVITLIASSIIISSVTNSRKAAAYTQSLTSINGVKHAHYEIQHPGVPTNNSILIFAVIDMDDSDSIAQSIDDILRATYNSDIKPTYSVSVYLVSSRQADATVYNDRKIYFQSSYVTTGEAEKLDQAAKQLGLEIMDNSVKTNKADLVKKYK